MPQAPPPPQTAGVAHSTAALLPSPATKQAIGNRMFKGRDRRPVFTNKCSVPSKGDVDAPLLLGAATFGVGWGLAGLCPGPAIANLSTGAQCCCR